MITKKIIDNGLDLLLNDSKLSKIIPHMRMIAFELDLKELNELIDDEISPKESKKQNKTRFINLNEYQVGFILKNEECSFQSVSEYGIFSNDLLFSNKLVENKKFIDLSIYDLWDYKDKDPEIFEILWKKEEIEKANLIKDKLFKIKDISHIEIENIYYKIRKEYISKICENFTKLLIEFLIKIKKNIESDTELDEDYFEKEIIKIINNNYYISQNNLSGNFTNSDLDLNNIDKGDDRTMGQNNNLSGNFNGNNNINFGNNVVQNQQNSSSLDELLEKINEIINIANQNQDECESVKNELNKMKELIENGDKEEAKNIYLKILGVASKIASIGSLFTGIGTLMV